MQIRCPHCQNPFEVVQDDESFDYDCPSCGSSFNLAADTETVSHTVDEAAATIAHFRLTERLGNGKYGTVWKAQDIELDRTVAVKIPRKEKLDAAEGERFLREARTAAQLKHPHIVAVHEVGRHEETLYIASDYVQGANLAEWLSGHRLTARESVELCVKVAGALEHAHQAGVIHRDLKPQNVMMDLDGEPLLTGFGLARREAGEITMTVEGDILGTPAYMPPEQARGEGHQADARNDVYSLGVILYELLTGERPFRGEVRMLIVQILQDDPPSPRKLNRGVPRDLETITLKCLEKEASRRYQTAQALADDLTHWLDGEPITARPVTWMERSWRWCKRNATVATLTAGLIFVFLAGLSGTIWKWREADKEATEAQRSLEVAKQERDRADREVLQQMRERRKAYVADMRFAHREWKAANIAGADELLERYKDDDTLHGFEWYYLQGACHAELVALKGVTLAVGGLSYSSDGKRIAGGSAKTLKVWDAQTGQVILNLKGHTDQVWSVAFSPDGKRLASAGMDTTVKLWDASTGRSVLTLEGHTDAVRSVAFGPNGKRLASASVDKTVKLWEVSTGRELLTFTAHPDSVRVAVFSPDGKRLASASRDGTVIVWDADSGEEVRTVMAPFNGSVVDLALSPEGTNLAVAYRIVDRKKTPLALAFSGELRLLDTQTGENVHTFTRSGGYFSSLVFSPNGNQLAIAEVEVRKDNSGFPVRSSIVLWNVPTKTQTNLLESYPGGIYRLVFSPDGRRLVAGHGHVELYDSRAKIVWRSEVKVWDAQRGQSAWVVDGVNGGALFHGQPFAFSSESNRLAFRRNSALEVWDLQTGDSVLALRQDGRRFETFVFSPGGNQMATTSVMADGEGLPSEADLKVWNLQTERKVSALKGQPGISQSLTFSPDGSRLASASNVLLKGTDTVDHALLKVQDPHANREILTLKETDRTVMDVMFSQDGQELVAIFLAADGEESFHSELKVWEIETGREILTFKKDGCWFSCMLSKANRLLVAGFEGLPGR